MTRLYYTDSLLLTFDATVATCEPVGDRFHVTLDQSAFYPTSGGQPHDIGTLQNVVGASRVNVVDVIDDDAADAVLPQLGEVPRDRRVTLARQQALQ